MLKTEELKKQVAEMIVNVLNLENTPEEIEPGAPLFYEGLGLDSIDALELSLEIGERYGYQIRADSEDNEEIFASLNALTAAIELNRTK